MVKLKNEIVHKLLSMYSAIIYNRFTVPLEVCILEQKFTISNDNVERLLLLTRLYHQYFINMCQLSNFKGP